VRWDNTQDTPLPPEMKVGDNPLEGAIIDYYLSAPASGPVTLAITDEGGRVIREYSSTPPPPPAPDTPMANVPSYWFAPPAVLPTTAGMHRIAWDLRYPDPPALNFGYNGTLLDYREYTLNWHALPGQTPVSTLVGPMVNPGTYTATLTVNGRRYAQPITVVPDPRVTISPEALARQLRLQQRMVAGITATYDAFNYIQQLRDALSPRGTNGGGAVAADGPAAQTLDAELNTLATGPAGFGPAHRDLSRRLNDMLIGDIDPTPSVIAGVDGPCKAIDQALDRLRALQTMELADVSATRARGSVRALPAWSPPAAPACGAR
jgi:hypothetical protein